MKLNFLIVVFCIMLLIVGCNSEANSNESSKHTKMKLKWITQDKGFCVLTSTSDFPGKKQYNDPATEFLLVDELFSYRIPCSTVDDCYEILLSKDYYRSMAPEFEPYLACEHEQVTEVNFKSS